MSQSALPTLLQCLESMHSVSFTHDDLSRWPKNEADAILNSGILVKGILAETVECDGCDGHCIADVEIIYAADDIPIRAFVYCTEDEAIGRVEVELNRLNRWDARHSRLVEFLCKAFGSTSSPEECISGRLWWLSDIKINRMRSDIFLARGSTWPDAKEEFVDCAHIAGCSNPLVMVLRDIPQGKLFGLSARVTSLSRLLSIKDSSLILDRDEISELFGLPRIVSAIPNDIFEPIDDNYRYVRYRGSVLHKLSKTQAIIIRLMHEEYEQGHIEVPFGSLRFPDNIYPPGKMTDIFRPDDKHGRSILIAEVSDGIYKLNI